jgi:hypothetical protein
MYFSRTLAKSESRLLPCRGSCQEFLGTSVPTELAANVPGMLMNSSLYISSNRRTARKAGAPTVIAVLNHTLPTHWSTEPSALTHLDWLSTQGATHNHSDHSGDMVYLDGGTSSISRRTSFESVGGLDRPVKRSHVAESIAFLDRITDAGCSPPPANDPHLRSTLPTMRSLPHACVELTNRLHLTSQQPAKRSGIASESTAASPLIPR